MCFDGNGVCKLRLLAAPSEVMLCVNLIGRFWGFKEFPISLLIELLLLKIHTVDSTDVQIAFLSFSSSERVAIITTVIRTMLSGHELVLQFNRFSNALLRKKLRNTSKESSVKNPQLVRSSVFSKVSSVKTSK